MTVEEFLQAVEVDISTNKSPLGNQLKADLCIAKHSIDFQSPVESLNDEDKYQIGKSLILYHIKRVIFFRDNFIDLINMSIEYALENDDSIKNGIINAMKIYLQNMNSNNINNLILSTMNNLTQTTSYGLPQTGDAFIKAPSEYEDLAIAGRGSEGLQSHLISKGYYLSAWLLLEHIAKSNDNGEKDSLIYPVLFNFRHYVEFTIKDCIHNFRIQKNEISTDEPGYTGTHDLITLWKELKPYIPNDPSDSTTISAIDTLITELDKLDGRSDSFRYVHKNPKKNTALQPAIAGEQRIGIENLKKVMGRMYNFFEGISSLSQS
jgi:hypothetical protein